MELQILIFIGLFVFFNGMLFVDLKSEEQKVRNYLQTIIDGCSRVERGTFFSQGIPKDTQKASQWAQDKLNKPKWIFKRAIVDILYETRNLMFFINTVLVILCFILPEIA